jgi:hypothetical protein
MITESARLHLLAAHDRRRAVELGRLLGLATQSLPQALVRPGEFAFTLRGVREEGGGWRAIPAGRSPRYAAIVALGLARLPHSAQREILGGETCTDLVGRLARQLDRITSPGDAAVICWAAAETGHADLPRALARLADLTRSDARPYVVEAAWTVSALVAARKLAEVEEELARARARLLAARTGALFPHLAAGGGPWYRAHVGCFADQVYPVQALARLHASADDPAALSVAGSVAAGICAVQGTAGQWWWHYDSRTGGVVEGYPVYSVHQHAMAPMALLDLADAGGPWHMDAICRGLGWLSAPPETDEELVLGRPPLTWRKVARADPRKVMRGLCAASTRVRPGLRPGVLDRVFPATTVDHECRPYELGWLLAAWL